MAKLNFISAPDFVHKLIKLCNTSNMPDDVTLQLLLGNMDDIEPYCLDEYIADMEDDGLPFAFVQADRHNPPYCVIDLQCQPKRIILPPFLYIQTSELVSMVSTNGMYIHLHHNQELLYKKQYHIELDDRGYPYYDGTLLIKPDRLATFYGITH